MKKGYSGVAVFTRLQPLKVEIELPDPAYQGEGRIVHLEFPHFHYFNGYFPNGGEELSKGVFKRVLYKMGFFESFLAYAELCRKEKPIVVCGDFNIAHKEIDLARPKDNIYNTGFWKKNARFWIKWSLRAMWTLFATCMAIRTGRTHGGPIKRGRGKGTLAGVSIISSYQKN